jgi:uncharacterized protein YwgA
MDLRQIDFQLTLQKLGLDVTIESFIDSLIIQKAIYLAQIAGVRLGYFYRWYLWGPYSPAVADDAFAVRADLAAGIEDAKGWELDEASTQKLERIRDWITTTGNGADREALAEKLELLASVHFLIDRRQVANDEPAEIVEVLRRFEKPFGKKDVENALTELRSNAMLS